MPRIRQYAEKYSNEDFLREVRSKQGYYNLRTQEELGNAMGLPKSTMRKRLINPESLTIQDLRSMIRVLNLSPVAVLKFLGWSDKAIKSAFGE